MGDVLASRVVRCAVEIVVLGIQLQSGRFLFFFFVLVVVVDGAGRDEGPAAAG